MASHYSRTGYRQDFTATGAAVAAGDIVFIGQIACLAENAIAEDETGSVLCEGNITIPKADATSLAVGALVEMASGLAVAQGAGGGKVVGTVVKVLSTTEIEVKLNAGIAAITSD